MHTLQKLLFDAFKLHKIKIAVEYGSRKLSYQELDAYSDWVMDLLIANGIKAQSHVGILLDDRLHTIVLMIGILKCGCIFVPLDPNYPNKRIENMILISDTQVIFTDGKNHKRLKELGIEADRKIFNFEQMMQSFVLTKYKGARLDKKQKRIEFVLHEEDAVYIYFTSGSAGLPKAIVGKNKSLAHFIRWEIETFGINSTFRFSQFTSPSFDPFLRDIFVPLCAGAVVCIPEKDRYCWNRSV